MERVGLRKRVSRYQSTSESPSGMCEKERRREMFNIRWYNGGKGARKRDDKGGAKNKEGRYPCIHHLYFNHTTRKRGILGNVAAEASRPIPTAICTNNIRVMNGECDPRTPGALIRRTEGAAAAGHARSCSLTILEVLEERERSTVKIK